MKNLFIIFAFLFLLSPIIASAHERRLIKINDKIYSFVVGSLDEPIYVDDKTGVYLKIGLADTSDLKNFSSEKIQQVITLENELKVEIIAGSYKKTQNLSPIHGEPGSYQSIFFPSDPTTYTYRIFGKINETEVNIPFTCEPTSENAKAPEPNEKEVVISDKVTQLYQAGKFGCPKDPNQDSFPKERSTNKNLSEQIKSYENTLTIAMAIAVFAVLISSVALFRK